MPEPLVNPFSSIYRDIHDAIDNHDITKFILLTETKYVDIHANGDAFLYCAIRKGSLEIVSHIIDHLGGNIHAGRGIMLKEALNRGHTDIVRLLILRGAEMCVGHNQITSLWSAICSGSLELIKMMINELGYDISSEGYRMLRIAKSKGHLAIVQYFVEEHGLANGHDKELLVEAIRDGNSCVIGHFFIKHGYLMWPWDRVLIRKALPKGILEVIKYFMRRLRRYMRQGEIVNTVRETSKGMAIKYIMEDIIGGQG